MPSRLRSILNAVLRLAVGTAQSLALGLVVGVGAAVVVTYLTAGRGDTRWLRAVVTTLGWPFAGQRTEHIDVAVQAFPESHRIAAQTRLRVRTVEESRPRFLFLLNPELQLRAVHVSDAAGNRPARILRLSWLVIVEPDQPVAADDVVHLSFDYEGRFTADPPDPIPSLVDSRQIQLGPEAFWYPMDAQSFFTADVTFTLPRDLVVAHNDPSATRSERGAMQVVHWSSQRPIASIPLVAAPFRRSERVADDITYQLYLDEGVDLDVTRILDHMVAANRFLTARLGSAEFDSVSLYVTRHLRRGVNYGNGLIGVSLRYFRGGGGDGGFGLVAHEIAHNWWGATVAEQWLRPGTGGQWLVEGLAELSSLLASEDYFGGEALTRRLAGNFFDPRLQRAIRSMSMLDNVLSESSSRDTIYRKGSLVAYRLCTSVGYEHCFAALRSVVDRHRYQQATDTDLQTAFEEVTGLSLAEWFDDWIASDRLADLALVPSAEGLHMRNLGTARINESVAVWQFASDGSLATTTTLRVDESLSLDPGITAIVDPQLRFPDVNRANNRFPATKEPLHVAARDDGQSVVVHGDPWAWSAQSVTWRQGTEPIQSWEFEHGILDTPQWFPDGKQILVSYSDSDRTLPLILALAKDGTRRTVGRGMTPSIAADGSVFASRRDTILRFPSEGTSAIVTRQKGYVLDQPVASPDGKHLAYLAGRRNRLEIRLANIDGSEDRSFLVVERDRTALQWGPESDRLFALLGGNDDWQIWELPLDGSTPRVLVRDAAAIGEFQLSPDGSRVALTAAPERDYPKSRRRLYVLDLKSGTPREIDVPEMDVSKLAWADDQTILATGSRVGQERSWILPSSRALLSVSLRDLSVQELP